MKFKDLVEQLLKCCLALTKDNELREWALNHWKIYRMKYTGKVIDFKRSSLENWQNLKLEKPISLIPKSSIITNRVVEVIQLLSALLSQSLSRKFELWLFFCVPKVLKKCKGQRLVSGLKLRKNVVLYANAGVS